jgi:hypothetical protein
LSDNAFQLLLEAVFVHTAMQGHNRLCQTVYYQLPSNKNRRLRHERISPFGMTAGGGIMDGWVVCAGVGSGGGIPGE